MSLIFERVSFRYEGARADALSDVSLAVADGEFLAVIGHSGSGKSTFVQLCNAMKVPTRGRVSVDGNDTALRRKRPSVRRLVGVVSQYPERQLFAQTVREDVGFGPSRQGMAGEELDSAVREAMALVGLEYDHVAELSPFELSGGQRRRVALAGIVAMAPKVLVLDEPMAGLDPQGREEVLGILSDLHAQGSTIVMVSHSMEDVARVAGRVAVLDHGRLADVGSPREVFSHEDILLKAGLDVPLPARFAKDLATAGAGVGDRLPLTVDELADAIAAQLSGRGGA